MRFPTEEYIRDGHSNDVLKLLSDDLAQVGRAMLRLDQDVQALTEHVHSLLHPDERDEHRVVPATVLERD